MNPIILFVMRLGGSGPITHKILVARSGQCLALHVPLLPGGGDRGEGAALRGGGEAGRPALCLQQSSACIQCQVVRASGGRGGGGGDGGANGGVGN